MIPIVSTPVPKSRATNPAADPAVWNAELPIEVTLSGIAMEFSLTQFSNAEIPIDSTVLVPSKVRVCISVQSTNALSPIEVTLSGIVTVVKAEQDLNA